MVVFISLHMLENRYEKCEIITMIVHVLHDCISYSLLFITIRKYDGSFHDEQ